MKGLSEFILGSHKHLSYVIRYSTVPKIKPESVAEHSYFVAMYSDLLCTCAENVGIKVNRLEVLRRALLHDVEESISSDLPYNVKHGSRSLNEEIKRINLVCMNEIVAPLGEIGAELFEVWQRAKDDDIEGRIVNTADSLSVIVYCIQELTLGNRAIIPVCQKGISTLRKRAEGLPFMAEIIAELEDIIGDILRGDFNKISEKSSFAKMIGGEHV